jgi:hypothetical protein
MKDRQIHRRIQAVDSAIGGRVNARSPPLESPGGLFGHGDTTFEERLLLRSSGTMAAWIEERTE